MNLKEKYSVIIGTLIIIIGVSLFNIFALQYDILQSIVIALSLAFLYWVISIILYKFVFDDDDET